MSDNNGQTAAEQSESAAADPHAVNEPEANGPEQRPAAANRRTVSAGIARLALVLALAAAVMSGWHWYAGQQDSAPPVGETDEFRSLQTELNGIIERVERLGVQINDLSRQSASLAAAADDTEITLAGMRDRLAALEESESRRSDRIAQLERRVEEAVERLDEAAGDRRQADREVARRIELHEVSGLLRLGQARAELAGDFARPVAPMRGLRINFGRLKIQDWNGRAACWRVRPKPLRSSASLAGPSSLHACPSWQPSLIAGMRPGQPGLIRPLSRPKAGATDGWHVPVTLWASWCESSGVMACPRAKRFLTVCASACGCAFWRRSWPFPGAACPSLGTMPLGP